MTRLALLLVPLLLGCHSHGGGGGDVDAYEGCATDENTVLLDDLRAAGRLQGDPATGPQWLAPMQGARLPAASPPTFRFQPSPGDVGRENGTASCPDRCPTCAVSPRHLPPVSGNVYELRLIVAGTLSYRLLTSLQRWEPPADRWAALAGPATLELVRVGLLRNEVKDGPAVGPPLSFEIVP